ncbi:unnamed protein product [Closterium sp. Naga37s-1]|nr:unnamed protein product [Closterium sp. Naga37s-1]
MRRSLPAFRAQACSVQRGGSARPGSILAGFEYPEHVCGVAWRDEYVRLHARIRAASRDAWRARQPPDAPSPATSPSPAPAPAPASSHESPPLASAPPPQPTATSRRRLADHYPSDVDKPAELAAADDSAAADAPYTPPAVRFLAYDWFGTCGGVGDYLIGLVSIFPVALLDCCALLVAQPCMHAAFHSPHIDTAPPPTPSVPMEGKPQLRATPLDAPGTGAGDSNSNVEDFWYPPPLQVKWILITNSHPLKQALKAKYPDKVCNHPHLHPRSCSTPSPPVSLFLLPSIAFPHHICFLLFTRSLFRFLLSCLIPPLPLMRLASPLHAPHCVVASYSIPWHSN